MNYQLSQFLFIEFIEFFGIIAVNSGLFFIVYLLLRKYAK